MTRGTFIPLEERGIPYTAPGRMFDWTYPPDRDGKRRAAFRNMTAAFDGLSTKMGTLAEAIGNAAEALKKPAQQADYALVDGEEEADAPEEAQDPEEG